MKEYQAITYKRRKPLSERDVLFPVMAQTLREARKKARKMARRKGQTLERIGLPGFWM